MFSATLIGNDGESMRRRKKRKKNLESISKQIIISEQISRKHQSKQSEEKSRISNRFSENDHEQAEDEEEEETAKTEMDKQRNQMSSSSCPLREEDDVDKRLPSVYLAPDKPGEGEEEVEESVVDKFMIIMRRAETNPNNSDENWCHKVAKCKSPLTDSDRHDDNHSQIILSSHHVKSTTINNNRLKLDSSTKGQRLNVRPENCLRNCRSRNLRRQTTTIGKNCSISFYLKQIFYLHLASICLNPSIINIDNHHVANNRRGSLQLSAGSWAMSRMFPNVEHASAATNITHGQLNAGDRPEVGDANARHGLNGIQLNETSSVGSQAKPEARQQQGGGRRLRGASPSMSPKEDDSNNASPSTRRTTTNTRPEQPNAASSADYDNAGYITRFDTDEDPYNDAVPRYIDPMGSTENNSNPANRRPTPMTTTTNGTSGSIPITSSSFSSSPSLNQFDVVDNEPVDNSAAGYRYASSNNNNNNGASRFNGNHNSRNNSMQDPEDYENRNRTSISFLSSILRHIDKQWSFAEVILIIVITATLNLVTIIGNIMVLISFKMDRS